MTRKQRFFRLPRRIGTTCVLMVSILLFGIGLQRSYKLWITQQIHREFDAANIIVTRPAKSQVNALRRQNGVKVYTQAPDKITLPKGSKARPFYKIATKKPVIFVTIDDGVFKTKAAADFMSTQELPTTSFLTIKDISNDFDYFTGLNKTGTVIENHTVNHPWLSKMPLDKQKQEICGTSKVLKHVYGKAPTLLRPPYGDYNANTERAAAACGMKGLVLWNVVIEKGKFQYQAPAKSLHAGDIVLLHFSPDLKHNLQLLIKQANKDGMQIGQLTDWVH